MWWGSDKDIDRDGGPDDLAAENERLKKMVAARNDESDKLNVVRETVGSILAQLDTLQKQCGEILAFLDINSAGALSGLGLGTNLDKSVQKELIANAERARENLRNKSGFKRTKQ